jgi:hypothetical protein
MATISLATKPKSKRITVEIDADGLERLAASLGLLRNEVYFVTCGHHQWIYRYLLKR